MNVMNLMNLAFPYTQFKGNSNLSLQSIEFSNQSNNSKSSTVKITIEKNNSKSEFCINKSLDGHAVRSPISFIENDIIDQDDLNFPLLVKIPNDIQRVKFLLNLNLNKDDCLFAKNSNNNKIQIYENLIVVKLVKEKDLSAIQDNIINGIIDDDKIKFIGNINIHDESTKLPTQSLLLKDTKNLQNDYLMPTSGDIINIVALQFFKPTDYGKITFMILNYNKDENFFTKLLKFSIWKENSQQSQDLNAGKIVVNSRSNTKTTIINMENFKSFQNPIEDGPVFRSTVSNYEEKIPLMKNAINQMLQDCQQLENSLSSSSQFKLSLIKSVEKFNKLTVSSGSFKKLIDDHFLPVISQSNNEDRLLMNNLKAYVVSALNNLVIKNNLDVFQSNKKIFDEESQKYYAWLNKYLSSGKSKDEKFLMKRKAFELAKYDYLNYLHDINDDSNIMDELVNNLIMFINKQRGYNSLISSMSEKEYEKKSQKHEQERKLIRKNIENAKNNEELNSIFNTVSSNGIVDPSSKISKYGLLYTYRGQGKQGWHKEWIVLSKSILYEYSDWRKGLNQRSDPIDIALCSVKPISSEKRKNCFEVFTSKSVKHIFQAISEEDRDSWIKALYNAGQQIKVNSGSTTSSVGTDINSNSVTNSLLISDNGIANSQILKNGNGTEQSSPDANRKRISSISLNNLTLVQKADESNMACCDCGSKEGVDWVSINLLVIFCVNCSSCHRSLGSNISKVKSLRLDNFNNETISLLPNFNNATSNEFLEYDLAGDKKIISTCSDSSRLEFITNKYKLRKYINRDLLVSNSANELILHGLKSRNFHEMLRGILLDGNVNMMLEKNDQAEFSLFEYSLTKPAKRKFNSDKEIEIFDISEFLILNGCYIGDVVSNTLNLSNNAKKYWQNKIDNFIGSGYSNNNNNENGNDYQLKSVSNTVINHKIDPKALKINTSVSGNSHNDKFMSPSSASSRYSMLFKKINRNIN
ncbi:hypothetical protein PACTADRAFT_49898 [Pachysolen tannophilus NRRL Y-2460]|uniref:ADP-ribosylation factor GTPase-activating protein n=1 Tax=Pachysolen tannophilus NRRL Y-2460 TaxID=669874 RepID=A0A1E4TTN9_PACTA|nr:hypothetical protein PACTADRAFT_49898 [Pachysolen tannophilus NRRL Y-2460]